LDDQAQAVVQYEGTVKADRGTVAYDRVQLAYCHIVAPINGRIGLRLVDPGNTVFAGSSATLTVITQLQPITVVFNVSEDDLPQVQAQLRAGSKLTVDAFDRANERQIESGTLTSLDNEVDTTTGTVKFRATFPNTNLSLFPNQFVNARLLVETLHKATLVPSAAVQHNGTNAFVYIVKPDNTVAVQPVTALTDNEKETAVQGVGPGVNLATSGFDRLENGAQVLARAPTHGQLSSGGRAGNLSAGGN
jgi:membrane fusion protein, multidrug efflux system